MRLWKTGAAVGMGLLSTSLHAQTNVQIYGIADAGVEYVTKVPVAGGGTGSLARLQSGNAASSRLGFRGREDLGGGLAATFTLESGFALDNGTLSQGGRLFGRQAYVGLGSGYGEIQLGRTTTPIYEYGLVFDPVGPAVYSSAVYDLSFVGRADNAVKYAGRFGGLKTTAQYSLGYNSLTAGAAEVPGASRVGKEIGLHADYTVGGLVVGGAFDRKYGTTIATQRNTDERIVVGATYEMKPLKLFASYLRQTAETPGTKTQGKYYWLGANYAVTPALTLLTGAYFFDPAGADNKSTMYTLMGSYALSKRTDIYSLVSTVKTQARSTAGLSGTVNAGDNQSGLIIGLRHRF